MGKRYRHFFKVVYDSIIMILACNEDMHNILDEFEFGQDLKTGCTWVSKQSMPPLFLGCY